MRYENIKYRSLFFAVAALTICLVPGCKAKKNLERTEASSTGSEYVARTVDSIRNVETTDYRGETGGIELEQSYTRVVEFDGSGGVQSISESWRDRRSEDMAVYQRHSELVSVTGSEKEVIERDSSSVEIHETKHTTADSRPVQGFEWVWIIVGIVAAIFLILFFRRKLE